MRFTHKELLELNPCEDSLSQIINILGINWDLTPEQLFNKGISIRQIIWVMNKLNMDNNIIEFIEECYNHVPDISNIYSVYADSYTIYASVYSSNAPNERKWQKNKLIEILK